MKESMSIFFCPPLSKFPEQPEDQSKCELIDCPKCKEKMWMSEKKKLLLAMAEATNHEVLLTCYDCFMKIVKENPKQFTKHILIDISK